VARPSVSVVVPFSGSDEELGRCRAAVAALGAEQVLVHDNRVGEPRSSYFARQAAAREATGEWLVFLDADVQPAPGLLDAYFDPPPGEDVGVLAGAIEDWVDQDTLVARYIADRRKLDQATTLAHPHRPYAQTANCAVRRAAFEAVGGFAEPVRSGGDADLCWRLQAAGWRLEARPRALGRHRNRARLGALLGQLHRHGSGMQWLDRRYPGAFPPPTVRDLAGRLKLLAGRPLAYAALDFAALWARDIGRLRANGDPTPP
jgi:GT2 family glycosyltransferase